MKTKMTFTMCKKMMSFASLAALTLACSNDNELTSSDKGNGNNEVTNYVCVKIVQPKTMDSRAAGSGFEYGSDEENAAATGLFFLFNSAGEMYGEPQIIPLTPEGNTGNTPEVEKIYNAVLVIDGVAEKPSDLQIVCVLNAPEGIAETTTLKDLTEKIGDYSAHEPNTFIMTNSVYKEGGDMVLGATVQEENIFDNAEEALYAPVDIYVERVVAKVRVKSPDEGGVENNGAKVLVDGEEKTLTIKITGIEIANIAEKSYLFKHIDKTWNDSTWIWDETNKRCYWETVPTDMTYGNKSYNGIVDLNPDFDIDNIKLTEYVQPNTSDQKTAVLVTAELLDEESKPFEFVYLRGGYFTPSDALDLIAQYVAKKGYYKKTNDAPLTYSQLTTDDFEWENSVDNPDLTWLESYEVVAKVKSGVSDLYKKNGEEYTAATAEDINKLLAGSADDHPYVARVYKDGKCYYFVNIDQTPVATDNGYGGGGKFEGVVRNHIYDLTVNSITGIGTPVFDPTDVIIPEKPEDENLFYLSANVNVLAWKLVKQTVNFD